MGLEFLLPLLGKLGLGDIASNLGRQQIESRMRKAFPNIKRRFEKEGLTPAELSDDDLEKRHLIRTAQYWLWKAVVKSGTAADLVRDQQDNKVVAVVLPAVSAEMTLDALLEGVLVATLDLTF